MREEFEKAFPVPYILAAWHESKGEYIPTPAGRSSLTVDVYNRQWQAWQAATSLQAERVAQTTRGEVEAVTKAILFAECGSTEDWEENTELGQAAIKAYRPFLNMWRNDAIDKAAHIAKQYAIYTPEMELAEKCILALKHGEAENPLRQAERVRELEEALRSIRGWRELRDTTEFPVQKVEKIVDEALSATAREG
jgi:hypothetical protein